MFSCRNSVQKQQSPDATGELGTENEDRIKMQETKMCTLLHRCMQGQFAHKGNGEKVDFSEAGLRD